MKEYQVPLHGDGDFRSDECVNLIDRSDIVITNPPFSIARELFAILFDHSADYIILGNLNWGTYKDVFNQIYLGRLRTGVNKSGGMWFDVPPEQRYMSDKAVKTDNGYAIHIGSIIWYTTFDHGHVSTFEHHGRVEDCERYDNYPAYNVDRLSELPDDDNIYGVPLTYIQYMSDEYEILGLAQKYGLGLQSERLYSDYHEIDHITGRPTGANGGKMKGNPAVLGRRPNLNWYVNNEGREVTSLYVRIFIRRKRK